MVSWNLGCSWYWFSLCWCCGRIIEFCCRCRAKWCTVLQAAWNIWSTRACCYSRNIIWILKCCNYRCCWRWDWFGFKRRHWGYWWSYRRGDPCRRLCVLVILQIWIVVQVGVAFLPRWGLCYLSDVNIAWEDDLFRTCSYTSERNNLENLLWRWHPNVWSIWILSWKRYTPCSRNSSQKIKEINLEKKHWHAMASRT